MNTLRISLRQLWRWSLPLMLVLTLSPLALADPPQGRGRGKVKKAERYHDDYDGRDRYDDDGRYERRRTKKEEKFINGHDARDGRWDGRGPKLRGKRLPPRRSPRW